MREATGSQISARLLEVIAHADFEVLPELYRFGPPTVRRDAAGGGARVRTGWRRLEHADLVVQALDEAERHLVLRVAVGGDAVPVPRDHCGKLLVGAEPLPLQSGAPVVEEAPGPALPLVLPELAEGLLEDVGGVEPLVRGEQRLESAPAVEREVLAVGEQRVLLALA